MTDILKLANSYKMDKNGNITKLDFSNLKLNDLPELPPKLKILKCYNNKLNELPELPSTLEELCLGTNKIIRLPELPPTLQVLNCSINKLTILPELPIFLRQLFCDRNNLTTLPISIIFTNIEHFDHNNNPMNELPLPIRRWLNKRHETKEIGVYNDSQSVHNSNIHQSIKQSIINLLNDS